MIEIPDAEFADTSDLLKWVLYAHDERRGRSTQKAIGASELGGCRRRTWFRLLDHPEVNYTRKWAAIKGTAFHAMIEQAFQWLDPDGERFLPEVTVPGAPGMGPGHVDLVDLKTHKAIDWKTTSKKTLRYFPKPHQRWQVQVYGDLLVKAGYQIDLVELVGIPMDGDEDDIRVHTEPRDPAIAAQAYEWLAELQRHKQTGEFPPADHSGVICEQYCPFFGPDTCSGKHTNREEMQ